MTGGPCDPVVLAVDSAGLGCSVVVASGAAVLSAEQLQDFGLINALFARCEMEVVGPPLE